MPAFMITTPDQASPALHASLYAEWEKFREGGAVDPALIPPYILHSWRRCREAGITTGANRLVRVDGLILEQALRLNADLLTSARTIMEKLFSIVRASRCGISLTDGSGLVLHTRGSDDEGTPDVMPGQIATEEVSRTNGIGTCLVERRAVTIIGPQHYCERHHGWSCTAAPILREDGTLAGVLNVSIAREHYHLHTRGMVEASAHAIGEQLRLLAALGEQQAIMEVLDEGILVLDETGVVRSANARGLSMLGLDTLPLHMNLCDAVPSEALRRDILGMKTRFQDRETPIHTAGGTLHCVLSFAPRHTGRGGVLALRETRRLCDFAAKAAGAGAVYGFDDIPGNAPALTEAKERARLAAQHDAPVLLLGETGTERDRFAQAIHKAGRRRDAPFIAVNCGTLPPGLARRELFGCAENGGKPGKCELADGGTLFLDDAENLPLAAQADLVRLLRHGEIVRHDEERTRTVNVRIIAGAGPQLAKATRDRLFLRDVYAILNACPLFIPSLRERRSDMEALVNHFVPKLAQTLDKRPKPFSPEALNALFRYPWPGNVRELETVLERALALAEGDVIALADLPASVAGKCGSSGRPLPSRETEHIIAALERTGGNVREAAKHLGISRGCLYLRLKKLGLDPDEYR